MPEGFLCLDRSLGSSFVQTSLLIQNLQTLAETVCVKEGLESAQRRLRLKHQGSMNMLSKCLGMFLLLQSFKKEAAKKKKQLYDC